MRKVLLRSTAVLLAATTTLLLTAGITCRWPGIPDWVAFTLAVALTGLLIAAVGFYALEEDR
jgi:hypothetical protein